MSISFTCPGSRNRPGRLLIILPAFAFCTSLGAAETAGLSPASGNIAWYVAGIAAAFLAGLVPAILLHRWLLRRWNAIFSTMPAHVVVADETGKLRFIRTGKSELDSRFSSIDDLPAEVCDLFRKSIRHVLDTGETRSVEYNLIGRRWRAELAPLPKQVFGIPTVVWNSTDITEMHALSERFRLTLKSIGDGVIAVDSDERITLVNRIAEQLTGYGRDEMIGRKFEDRFHAVCCRDDSPVDSPVRKALRLNRAVELANHTDLVTPAGRRHHIADSAAPIRDEAGSVSGAVLVFRDVTEAYEKRDRLERQNILLQTAAEIAEMVYFSSPEDPIAPGNIADNRFWAKHDDGTAFSPEEWIAEKDRNVVLSGRELLKSGKADSFSAVYAAGSEGRVFEMRVVRKTLPGNLQFEYFGIIRDVTAAIRLEHRQNDMSQFLETLLANLPCSVYVKESEKLRFTLCNKMGETVIGRTTAELIGKNDSDFLPPEQADRILAADREALASNMTTSCVHEFSTPSGALRHGKFFRRALTRSDGSRVLLGVCMDITDELSRERELRETNLLLQLIINSLPCTLWIKDLRDHHRYILANNFYHQLMGLPSGAIVGKTDFDFHPAELAQEYVDGDRAVLSGGERLEFDEELESPLTGNRHLHTVKIPLIDYKASRELLLGMSFDVTELTENRNTLRRTNDLLQSILDHLPAVVAAKDADNDFRYLVWNKTAERILGIKAADVIGKSDFELPWKSDFAPLFRADDVAAIHGESRKTMRNFSFAGQSYDLQTIITGIRGAGKDSSRVLILSIDVTEEKRLEEERRQLLANLQAHSTRDRLLNSCLESILLCEDEATAIGTVLKAVCMHLGAGRCYIMEYDYQHSLVVPKHEWHPPERPSIMTELPAGPLSASEPWLIRLSRGEELLSYDIAAEDSDQHGSWTSHLEQWNVRSLYCAGIRRNAMLWGHIGVTFEDTPRRLAESDLLLIRAAAHMIEILLQRKTSRDALEALDRQNRIILDAIPIPLCLFDRNGHLERTNPVTLAALGCTCEELSARPCYQTFCRKETFPADCPLRKAAGTGLPAKREVVIKGREYQITATPIRDASGTVSHILECGIDLTEVNNSKRELEAAMKSAEAATRAKSSFLATMSHELRTPLNAVIGFSELLQDDALPRPEQLEYLRSINLAGNSLLGLINDVLDLSKLEAEQMELALQPTDLAMLLQELHAVFQYKIREKKLDFEIHIPRRLPGMMLDRVRLRQILLNLLGNAVKFTRHGTITISVTFAANGENSGTLTVSIADTGIGIRKDAMLHLFQPFFQQDVVRDSHAYQGTGLGLAISRRLADRMGGTLRVESEEHHGSCFTLELPGTVCVSAPSETDTQTSAVRKIPRWMREVLLVDDVPMNLKVLEAMLKKLGISTVTATSGREALECLDRRIPDLILTDLWMPGMNGMELAAAIHAKPETARIKIVAVTADTEADGNFALDEFCGVLRKPLTREKLEELLDKLQIR